MLNKDETSKTALETMGLFKKPKALEEILKEPQHGSESSLDNERDSMCRSYSYAF